MAGHLIGGGVGTLTQSNTEIMHTIFFMNCPPIKAKLLSISNVR